MKKLLAIVAFTVTAFSAPYVVANIQTDHQHISSETVEHGGRTNSSGCHNDTKQGTYHCH